VSELVTNSVRHARLATGELIRLNVDWSGTRLRVHVHDGGRRGGRLAASGSIRPTPAAESGWGLYLVDRLASRWGLDTDGYWFELHHIPPADHAPDRQAPRLGPRVLLDGDLCRRPLVLGDHHIPVGPRDHLLDVGHHVPVGYRELTRIGP
jgi:hypothetical protein